jgi:uroporphyrinogen III methyltransferase/synthase
VATGADIVVVMGMRNLAKIVEALLAHGRAPETPAAVVMEGGTPRQRVVEAPLAELAQRVAEAELAAPAVIVVGDVVRLRAQLAWWESGPLFGKRVL